MERELQRREKKKRSGETRRSRKKMNEQLPSEKDLHKLIQRNRGEKREKNRFKTKKGGAEGVKKLA